MQEIILVAIVMVLGLGAYWSMVVFPKQRDFQSRQRFVRTLAEGDEVITIGGMIGRVVGLSAEEGIAYVEIADGVVVRLIASSILSPFDPEALAKNAQMGLEDNEQQDEQA